jgi:DNA polymerase I-like protein with 3'-5' exonuclease and polymerase domains
MKITHHTEKIRSNLENVRQEADGSVTANCEQCAAEGHPGKRIKVFIGPDNRVTGVVCPRYAGTETHSEHTAPVRARLNFQEQRNRNLITSSILDGAVTLEIEPSGRAAQFVTVRNGIGVLHNGKVRLARLNERAEFISSIDHLSADERAQVGRELAQMLDRLRRVQEVSEPEDSQEKESAATRLVRIAREETQLVRNADGEGFAVMTVAGHKETWSLRSKGFRRWLAHRFYELTEKSPGSQAIHDALGVIEGLAVYSGPERKIFIRVGEKDGRIYVDLADEEWRAIEIDADGWRVVSFPPIEFRRSRGMLPLPAPERGGSLEELLPFMNLAADSDLWKLLKGSLVMKFRPTGPYPVDAFMGEQGSGKSTRARMVRMLVDPNVAAVRSEPREVRDLQIAATNEWQPVFDNLSRIPDWLSDAFCCLSTGGALRIRELYTDADEAIFATMRPLILTSIEETVSRPDLLDRTILYHLPVIDQSARKSEKQLWQEFEAARPRILGALLDAVSVALRREDLIEISDPPRMADFACWAEAAAPALGLKPGEFLQVYRRNLNRGNDLAIEAAPFAEALIELAEQEKAWAGTAKALLETLLEGTDEAEKRKRKLNGWPMTPRALSGALRRIAPNLRRRGVETEFDIREGKQRNRLIWLAWTGNNPDDSDNDGQDYGGKTPSASSAPSATEEPLSIQQFTNANWRTVGENAASAENSFASALYSTQVKSPLADGRQTQADGARTQNPKATVRLKATENIELTDENPQADEADGEIPTLSYAAIDTETEEFTANWDKVKTWKKLKALGRAPVTPRNARLQGISVSYDGVSATYETDPEAWPLLLPEPEQTAIFHNAAFDLSVLERAGLEPPAQWECTHLAARLIDENADAGLKPLAERHLGADAPVSWKEISRLRLLDPGKFADYACGDAKYTRLLWKLFEPELERQQLREVYALEKRLAPVVAKMERRGMRLDLEALRQAENESTTQLENLERQIYESAGMRWNLNSMQDTAAVLFDKLGLKSPKLTRSGSRSVDSDALEELIGQHPVIPLLIQYREVSKLAKSFIETLPVLADEQGRIHPHYNQTGADTGRFTCKLPNIQQIPKSGELGKKLRSSFIADTGNALIVADYSQQELRALAHYSKDPALLEAFRSGADLHTRTASLMFGKVENDITKEERAIGKMLNFGTIYGLTAQGLLARLVHEQPDLTLPDCERFISEYFRAYSGVSSLLNRVAEKARARGYVRSLLGRRRHLWARNRREERQVCNFLIQGSSADITKTAMVRLDERLPKGADLVGCIHDELVIEAPVEIAEVVKELTKEVMRTAVPENFAVPMEVDAHIASSWGEAK